MPTRALRERGELLRRALDSVLAQQEEGFQVVPLVIVNGPAADPALTRELRADPRVRVATLDQPDLPAALRAGRDQVDTPYFAELDDDDLLLPGALAARVEALEERPGCHAVVTNGFRRDSAGDTLNTPDAAMVQQEPIRALLKGNWLLPGSWLCRTDAVGPELFQGMPKYLECTWLALKLASGYPMRFLERPTVVWHVDTPLSVSQSRDYLLGQAAALGRILELDLPNEVRASYRGRVAYACHAAACLLLKEGCVKQAWGWHLRSLKEPGGWRYVPLTRGLVRAWWGA